ncbi:stage III sporulation protein AB [Caldanaerobius fijiensis DSM 17918]|uniref:Stage III sporulation protein AB n=1 Tax=Caldanaerobius fijiensis DSM 17918 TaxID=1121256 RepID=A0A1M4U6G2_9THEO|nr:stage III sporulation protein SpoIIIAB [Caldanaerobius fijiensis]SHE52210.1 stage III sporulation protein AB [Caldanaerobius fijiensis DSM 17918]
MILKILGSTMVLFSTTFLGISIANNYKLRLTALRDIQRCLEYLMTEVIYVQTPLPEAFINTAKIASKEIAPLFEATIEILEREENCSIKQAFIKSLEKLDLPLDREDIKIIKHLGNTLGSTDVENQVRAFKLALSRLSKQEELALKLKEKNEKLFKEIGFLCGAIIVILLI